jgi:LytS/YehU family sensor histidine kinase
VIEQEKEKNRIQRQVYEMETRVLKAQMNPHFIFNSMNSIQQFILANDNANANAYLVKFARLLRKILESSTDEHISLDNELDILNKYIEIESLRFEDAFSYEIVVDDKLNRPDTRIPHMLIQPFVENAIWHGLLMKESDKNLKIFFEYVDEHSLWCVVDDNGAGRRAQKTEGSVPKKKSLGIHFTAQRLELMRKEWGGDYGVEIADKVNAQGVSDGTRVKIKIPILKN